MPQSDQCHNTVLYSGPATTVSAGAAASVLSNPVEMTIAAVATLLGISGSAPESQRTQPQYVIRGGLAAPQNLITGSTAIPGTNLSGFSVTTATGMTVNQLAMVANYPNPQISYTTTNELSNIGVPVVPTPSANNPLHATAVVPVPLDPARAAQISGIFTRIPNPTKCRGGG